MLIPWKELPSGMQCSEVREYYDLLQARAGQLKIKRAADVVLAVLVLLFAGLPMAVIAVLIAADSPGPVFFRQERITAGGRRFRIHKFRTMTAAGSGRGAAVTAADDARITRIGAFLRRYRLDELPQLIDVLKGDMSFVGTRPEVPRYVRCYTPEMRATLLLPAGITSEASIRYKDEEKMLEGAGDVDRVYVEQILPEKMVYNLASLKNFSLLGDMKTMFRTVLAVFGGGED